MIYKIAKFTASIAGLGHAPFFPGTLSSILATVAALVIRVYFGTTFFTGLLLIVIFAAFLSIGLYEREGEKRDYSWIVIDEWIGMWIAILPIFYFNLSQNESIYWSLGALFLFRILDISKVVPPIKAIDNHERQSALFVILDDVIAGLYVYLILIYALEFSSGLFSPAGELRALFFSFIFLVPAMISNMTPVLVRKLRFLNKPISQKIFGVNKTWRGLIFGTIAGAISSFLLYKLKIFPEEMFQNLFLFEVFEVMGTPGLYFLTLGVFVGFGALGGDLTKSFFKRRRSIKEGESFTPWDQIDYILGVILISFLFYGPVLKEAIIWLIVGGFVSAVGHRLAYFLGLINTKR